MSIVLKWWWENIFKAKKDDNVYGGLLYSIALWITNILLPIITRSDLYICNNYTHVWISEQFRNDKYIPYSLPTSSCSEWQIGTLTSYYFPIPFVHMPMSMHIYVQAIHECMLLYQLILLCELIQLVEVILLYELI